MDTWVVCKVKGKMRDLTGDIARAYHAQKVEELEKAYIAYYDHYLLSRKKEAK